MPPERYLTQGTPFAPVSPIQPIPHQFQHSSSLQQYTMDPIVYSSGPAPLPAFIQAPPNDWQQQTASYYRAPSVLSGNLRYSPYGTRLNSGSSSASMSSHGKSSTTTSRKTRDVRESLEYWKLPGLATELSIIRLCFLNTHVFVMAGPRVVLSTAKIVQFLNKGIMLLKNGQELGMCRHLCICLLIR